jgi:hypothetical protein
VLVTTVSGCGGNERSSPSSSDSKAPTIETHSASGEGTFAGVRWRLEVTRDGQGGTCRTNIFLPDDGPGGLGGGECVSLDRLEHFLVVDRGIDSRGRLSYAAGIHSSAVRQLRLVVTNDAEVLVPLRDDVFFVLWEGTDNTSRFEFLDGRGRLLARCNLTGDLDPC